MVVCPNCGQENKDDFRFCQACGTPLAAPPAPSPAPAAAADVPCPKCSKANPEGMKFCKDCGSPLEAMAAPTPTPAPAAAPTPAPAPAAAPPPAASDASVVTCAGCGGETPMGFKFCQHCGAPLKAAPDAGAAASTPPPSGAATPKDPGAAVAADDSGVEARTILDMSSEGEGQGAPAAAQRPVAHTPPAGMPPGQAADVAPPPIAAEGSVGGADKTVGPSAGLSSTASNLPRGVLARLVSVQRDGSDGDVHEVTDTSFDVGRTEGHLCFDEDGYLSERHCRISLQDGEWRLTDLDSCNGVYLRITEPRPLEEQDQVLLGKQVLRFERVDDEEIAAGSEHGVLLFGSPLDDAWGRLKQQTVAGVARDVYYLSRPQVTIGREEGNITFPDDEFMSRKHMAVSFIDGKVIVQDLGSSNGTYVQLSAETALKPGTMLRVGDQLLRFELP